MNAGKVSGYVADWTENMSRLDIKGSWESLDFILLDLYFLCSICYLCFLFVFVFNRIYVTSTQQSSIQCVDSRHLGHHPPGWEQRSSRWTSQIHWKNNEQYIRKYIGRTWKILKTSLKKASTWTSSWHSQFSWPAWWHRQQYLVKEAHLIKYIWD